jgi:hypothetical protein
MNETTMIEVKEIAERNRDRHSDGEYTEKDFQEMIEVILEYNGVEYESEKTIIPPTEQGENKAHSKRCDIYIPKTDTVIELKLEADLRGIGQACYYAQFHRECLLLAEEVSQSVHRCAMSVPGIHTGIITPLLQNGAGFDLKCDGRTEFTFEACHGDLGDNKDWICKKSMNINRWQTPVVKGGPE